MSQSETNFKENFTVDCKMSAREYYDFRLQCLQNKVQFLVRWERTYCIVTCEAPFLSKCGYTAGVDF